MAIRTKPNAPVDRGRLNMYLETEMLRVIDLFAKSKNISLGGAARKLLSEALAKRGLWKVTDEDAA